jgi:hypothetical protein
VCRHGEPTGSRIEFTDLHDPHNWSSSSGIKVGKDFSACEWVDAKAWKRKECSKGSRGENL